MEIKHLIMLTLRIYLNAALVSLKQTVASWKIIFFHLLLLLVIGISAGNLIGGFVRGFLLAYALSVYLASIRSIIEKDKAGFKDLFANGMTIFSSVITVLFSLMIINFVLTAIGNKFLSLAFGILFSVLANPLPEIIYLRGGMLGQMLQDSFEFVKDNFFEWFLPAFLVIALFVSTSPLAFLAVYSDNPLQRIEHYLMWLSVVALNIGSWAVIIPLLFIMALVMVFRGQLYLALESGRRARIYKSKQEV